MGSFTGVILGLYWGYLGMMENEMEATAEGDIVTDIISLYFLYRSAKAGTTPLF